MDNIIAPPLPQVTTGPLPSSHKVYVTPEAAPDISVPLREITLSSPNEPPVRGLRHDRSLHRFRHRDRRAQGPGPHAPCLGVRPRRRRGI